MTIARIAPPAPPDSDQVLALLHGLAKEAQSSLRAFSDKLKPDAPPIDVPTLARETADLFSLFVDLATHTAEAHTEHYEWGGEVDDELERLGDEIEGGDESRLTPTDAGRLKATFLSLVQYLPSAGDDNAEAVRARAMEAITFIDGVTIVETDEEGDGDDDADDEADDEDETPN